MKTPRHVAVIDIGKTNAKLALVDLSSLSEIAVRRMPNRPRARGPYPHHDIDKLWDFILDSLAALGREHAIDAISVTTHGATAALVCGDGRLAMPVLDYEHDGPDALREDYDRVRPPFDETGTPALPIGLNLGAQLFWQSRMFPDEFATADRILTYPQYWSFRLTGVAASEATSLGCHTDLWNPDKSDFSSLVDAMGWRKLFPVLRLAGDALGPILPEIAARTGLDLAIPVFCGIHDSNASLYPHILARAAPFSVVSTGTWVISMAVGGKKMPLDPARDTLINVNALGKAVPSARFMGGREYETLTGGEADWSEADILAVLDAKIMLLPSVQQGSGPFPTKASQWIGNRSPTRAERAVAASFYLALMTATCLDLIGAQGPTIVEGPFARNRLFETMLSAATGRQVLAQAGQATGTSIGAALLARRDQCRTASTDDPAPVLIDRRYAAYARRWTQAVAG